MRFEGPADPSNIEDRRGQGGGGFRGGGGMKLGLGGMLLLGILSIVFKTDFFSVASSVGVTADPRGGPSAPAVDDPQRKAREAPLADLALRTMDDLQKFWTAEFASQGKRYPRTVAVLFWDVVNTACGGAESASGPFYCPGDSKVYIDLSFYDELHRRFGAPGDFAQAYVLAHEVGHHLQHALGIEERVRALQQRNRAAANQLSVRMELQADCLAGVWGRSAKERGILETGDVEEGLKAAAAIGDDAIQRMSGSRVRPESFTHGSSEQRVQWFNRGMESGKVDACDTFAR